MREALHVVRHERLALAAARRRVPAPDALQQLLAHVVTDLDRHHRPKLVLPRRRRAVPQISEVGVSISGTGRRELSLDPGEIDQGQRDQPRPGSASPPAACWSEDRGLHDLGGLDPALPVFRDGVEFGWRAHLRGYRVVTTPSARISHRQVGRAGLAAGRAAGRRPGKIDRLLGMVVVAGHAPTWRLPLVWLRLVWSCLLRAIGYLLGKAPGRARDELAGAGRLPRPPGPDPGVPETTARAAGRRRAPRRGQEPAAAVVVSLRVGGGGLLRRRRPTATARWPARSRRPRSTSSPATTSPRSPRRSRRTRGSPRSSCRRPVRPAASLLAARSLFGLGHLAGPALLPAPDSLGDAVGQRLGSDRRARPVRSRRPGWR